MQRARIAIRHEGCWGSRLVADERVRDVKFLAGLKVDADRIFGSMVVRTKCEMNLLEYNPYDLEHIYQEGTKLKNDEMRYDVQFIFLPDEEEPPVSSLLFDSGCLFRPPALVQGDFELQTVLAPRLENLQHLVHLLEKLQREFRILSLREADSERLSSPSVSWRNLLTPKQLAAIQIAFQEGFYRYPRNIRISDLAEEADVARSTFQEHLRLAEMKLVHFLLGEEV